MPALANPTHEVEGSRRGSGNISSGDSYEERKYKVYFAAGTTADSIDARNASGVPLWGAKFVGSDGVTTYALYVQEKSAEKESGSDLIWIVTVTYRTLQAFVQQPRFDPMTDGGKWNIQKSIVPYPYEIPIQKDRDGKVAVNVLGEPIKPPLTKVKCDFQINISYLTDSLAPDPIIACLEHVNDGSVSITIGGVVWTFSTNTIVLQSAPIQETFDNDGNAIAQVSLQILYKIDGWTAKIPNLSNNLAIDSAHPATGGRAPIPMGTYGGTSGDAMYLGTNGQPLNDGDAIVTKDFEPIDTADFTDLLDGIV